MQVISSLGNGGAEKLVVDLSNELSHYNKVILVSLNSVQEWMLPPKKILSSVELIELNKEKSFAINVLIKLYNTIKRVKPDVIHLHLNTSLIYFLPLLFFFKNKSFVFTIHSTFEPHKKFFDKISKGPLISRVIFICLTNAIKDDFDKEYPKLNFRVIENGIKNGNASLLKTLKGFESNKCNYKNVFLFVGRLSNAKNIPLLLDVFSDKSMLDSKVLIIGDGESALKEEVLEVERRTDKRVEYLGQKSNVVDYMASVDALILVSKHEGMPIVVLEALQVGLPIISTPVGGIPEMIDHKENGFLSKSLHKADILKALDEFKATSPKERSEISQRNKQKFISRFSIESCAKKHVELYHKILDGEFQN
jgi:glycosyltransferase involved in cell wall biosynthesis